MNRKGERQGLLAEPLPAASPSQGQGEPIFVEVGALFTKHLTGIGRHVARLVQGLAQLAPLRLVSTISSAQARRLQLPNALVCGQEMTVTKSDLPPMDPNLDGWVRDLVRRPRLRHATQLAGRSSCIFPALRPAERHFRREVSILHDFTPLIIPWAHVAETHTHFNAFFAHTLGLSDRAVAVSESTKADASWLGALPPEQVVVGHPGPSLCDQAHAYPGPVTRRDNVIVIVATLEPRKNGRFVFDWFLNTQVFKRDMQLWWVGPKGWLDDAATGRQAHERSDRRIRFLGMIPDRSLCQLYRQATFTIAPSLYEGFGFPVLDSLMHQTPVVSAFNSSLQEFAGPGVFYFDAYDPASLDRACEELLAQGPMPLCREDLRAQFSWEGFARTVAAQCA